MSDLHLNMEAGDTSDDECSKDFVDPFPNCRLSELVARMLGEDYIDKEKEEEQTEDTNDPFENTHDVQTAFISYLGDFKYLFREPLPSIEESEFEDELAEETELSKHYDTPKLMEHNRDQTKDEDQAEYTSRVVDTDKYNFPIENIGTIGSDVEVQTQTEPINFDFDFVDNNYVVQNNLLQTLDEETLSVEVDTDDNNVTFHKVSMNDLDEQSVNLNMNQQCPDGQECKFSWSVTSV